jgi:cell division septal protein FtsQ
LKSKTPKRRKKNAAARLRPFWILIGFLILLCVAIAAGAALWPGFTPRAIEISGNHNAARAEILAKAAIAPNVNVWLQNPRAIEARVETIPYVGTAHVHRIPPATIAIDVTERIPFAVATEGSQAVLVDRDLRVLQPANASSDLVTFALPPGSDLEPGVFLKTEEAVRLRTSYDQLIAAHVVPIALGYDKFGGLVATMRGGIRVMLGSDDEMARKIALIDPILAQVVRKGNPADAIDLRAPNTPVVVYKN